MEQPMFSLASYHGERKLAWKRICNSYSSWTVYLGQLKGQSVRHGSQMHSIK